MGQISYFFLKTLRQNPTDWLYHVFSLGHIHSSSKEKVLWLSTPHFYAAHTQVMHYWHSQRTTSSVKGLEQLFLSIATTPLCCQHCRRQVQSIFPRDSAVLDPKSSCRHRCSKKKLSLAIWSCIDTIVPKPRCHMLQQRQNTSPKHAKKDTPNGSFFQVLTTGIELQPIDACLSL